MKQQNIDTINWRNLLYVYLDYDNNFEVILVNDAKHWQYNWKLLMNLKNKYPKYYKIV